MTGFWAWLTPPGASAVAVMRLHLSPWKSGIFSGTLPEIGQARFGLLRNPDGSAVDEVVLTRLGDDEFELAVHGGAGVRSAVVAALRDHGIDGLARETTHPWKDLSRTPHPKVLSWFLQGRQGHPPGPERLWYRPLSVLITGQPNAGKSTLINAWSGRSRALVADMPGTTRDLVSADVTCGGWRLRLWDSAGIRQGGDHLERQGMALVAEARSRADAIVHCLPPGATAPTSIADNEILLWTKADQHDFRAPADSLTWAAPGFVGDTHTEGYLNAVIRSVLGCMDLSSVF